ncbi:MAG: helix-turn-helix domain-containing protein [Vibrio sp.]
MNNGELLRAALKSKGMKQTELAKKMGITRQQVNEWCKKGNFSLVRLGEILDAIGMTHAAFFSQKVSDEGYP